MPMIPRVQGAFKSVWVMRVTNENQSGLVVAVAVEVGCVNIPRVRLALQPWSLTDTLVALKFRQIL